MTLTQTHVSSWAFATCLALVAPSLSTQGNPPAVGAVYAMTNDLSSNELVAYAQRPDGTLSLIGHFATGGRGGTFDGGEGLDPLISAYAVLASDDYRFVFAVNAGSNSLSVFRVEDDFSLALTDVQSTLGVGPNSIAYRNGVVYVSNIDADGVFAGEPDQEGSIVGFRLNREGRLQRIAGGERILGNRPAAVRFSPRGDFLLVSSINAGSSALASGSVDELVSYEVLSDGSLSQAPIGTATSTLPGNSQGRNLPSAIGFEIVRQDGEDFVVVTEAREFRPDGSPPAFDQLQTGSVSTWRLEPNGFMTPIQLDVITGQSFIDGERTACWIDFSSDNSTFWVSNALESTLSSFSFNRGFITLLDPVAAAGTPPAPGGPGPAFSTSDGWVDLWVSADGSTLYQLFGLAGEIGAYSIGPGGLNQIQSVTGDLPTRDTQGIVAIGRQRQGAVYAMTNATTGNELVAYEQAADGTLTEIGAYSTGGLGAAFDGGEGLDPLISAYAVYPVEERRVVLAVNAGTNTIAAMRVLGDFSLQLTDVVSSWGVGPNSIAYSNGVVYVTNIDADGIFTGEPDQEGSLAAYTLSAEGELDFVPGSLRILGNRPSAVQVSPDGQSLVIASINAGSSALVSGSTDELVVYGLAPNGMPTANPVSVGASTLPGNLEGRNLPSAIGFEIVAENAQQYVVVTEAREFRPDGAPPAFDQLQTGSVSVWQLAPNGQLTPLQQDVITGSTFFDGERTACWIEFSPDQSVFWVSNALESTLSSFSFDNGQIALLDAVAAAGTPPAPGGPAAAFGSTDGWVDLWLSADGTTLYQLYGLDGTVGAFATAEDGSLTLIQELSGTLPDQNTQGIVAFGPEQFELAKFPGTSDDLVLTSAIGAAALDSVDLKDAEANEIYTVSLTTPSSTFVGDPVVVLLDLLAAGQAAPLPFVADFHLGSSFALFVGGGSVQPVLSPLGLTTALQIPPGLSGVRVLTQGIALSPQAANGLFAASDVHVLRIR